MNTRTPKPASTERITTITETTTRNPGLTLDRSQTQLRNGQKHTFTVIRVVTLKTFYRWYSDSQSWVRREVVTKKHAKFYGPTAASSAAQFITMLESGCTEAPCNKCAADLEAGARIKTANQPELF